MSLPPEVVEHILEWLPEDARILRAFALVSRAWTFGVQNRLYRRIIIDEKNKWPRLHKRLRAFPYLRPLVRELDFVLFVSFGKKTRFEGLFPRLERVKFNASSANAELLSALWLGAPETMRSLDVVIDSVALLTSFRQAMQGRNWRDISVRLEQDRGYQGSRYTDNDVSLGTLAVQSLSITGPEQRPILSVLHSTDLRTVTRLTLSFRCSYYHYTWRAEDVLGYRPLPASLLASLEEASIELKGYERVQKMRGLRDMFGDIARTDKFLLVVGKNKPALQEKDGTVVRYGPEKWRVAFN